MPKDFLSQYMKTRTMTLHQITSIELVKLHSCRKKYIHYIEDTPAN